MTTKIQDVEAALTVSRTAVSVAMACETRATDAFHAAWLPVVEAGQATFGDWAASFHRSVGRSPYHDEAERSGWCMVHPDRAIGIERWCMRCEIGKTATCGRVGCPGPAPKRDESAAWRPKTDDEIREWAKTADFGEPLDVRTITGIDEDIEPERTVVVHWQKNLPKHAVRAPTARAEWLIGDGFRLILWRSRLCRVADEAREVFDRLDSWLSEPRHNLEWSRVDPPEEMAPERVADMKSAGDDGCVTAGAGLYGVRVKIDNGDDAMWRDIQAADARSLASTLLRAADEVEPPKVREGTLSLGFDGVGHVMLRVNDIDLDYRMRLKPQRARDVARDMLRMADDADPPTTDPLNTESAKRAIVEHATVRALMESGRIKIANNTPKLHDAFGRDAAYWGTSWYDGLDSAAGYVAKLIKPEDLGDMDDPHWPFDGPDPHPPGVGEED